MSDPVSDVGITLDMDTLEVTKIIPVSEAYRGSGRKMGSELVVAGVHKGVEV